MEKTVKLRALLLQIMSFAAGAAAFAIWKLALTSEDSAHGEGVVNQTNPSAST